MERNDRGGALDVTEVKKMLAKADEQKIDGLEHILSSGIRIVPNPHLKGNDCMMVVSEGVFAKLMRRVDWRKRSKEIWESAADAMPKASQESGDE